MNMFVCIKQVYDPEAPPENFKIDPTTDKVVSAPGVLQVVDPYAEYAVEAALRIKDSNGGKVTAICLGTNLIGDVVKKPLCMGADELILLEDPAFDGGDSWSTAYALAMAIKKAGDYSIVFCGREASDWNAGQVGSAIAEILGLPCMTLAQQIELTDTKVKVKRGTDDGYEVVESPLPAVITVSNEIGKPRYQTVKWILAAKKKEPIILKPSDIGVDASKIGAEGRRSRLLKLFLPVSERKCEIISADTPEEAAVRLALRLRETKIL